MTKCQLSRPLTPYKDPVAWELETKSYIDRIRAMLSGASRPAKFELPPPRGHMESFLQVRLKRFNNRNAKHYEIGRIVSFQGDLKGRAFAALPAIPGKSFIWVLRVGAREHSYTPVERTKPMTKTIDVVCTKNQEDVRQFDHRLDALEAEAMALFDIWVADAALTLLYKRSVPWPLEPVGSTLQKYILADLIPSAMSNLMSNPSKKVIKNSAAINDRAIDNLRLMEGISINSAVAIVHSKNVEGHRVSSTGTSGPGKIREIAQAYRDRFGDRYGKPIDPLLPNAKYPGRVDRQLIADFNLAQSVERVVSELHLHARHRIAIDALGIILRDE